MAVERAKDKERKESEVFLRIFILITLTILVSAGVKSTVEADCSSAETVESASLSLESVDNIESSDSLSSGMFSVGD